MILQLMIMALTLLLLGGCAGTGRPEATGALITQVQARAKKTAIQENLLSQMSQSTLQSYNDYKVGPEDLLDVSFLGLDDLTRVVRVNGRGEISLPLAGPVAVAGMSPQEIETRLAQLYKDGRYIRNPQISVQVKEYRHQRVMVSGAVVQPGSYEVIGPRTLLEMLGKAGGLTDKAGERVQIVRQQSAAARSQALEAKALPANNPRTETIIIDLRRLLDGALDLNFPVKNGDIVYVPPAKSAFILGAVKKPGQVPVRENMTVTKALAMTEGLDPMLASNRVSLLRFDDRGEIVSIPVDLNQVLAGKATDPLLNENDIVFVSESGVKKFLFLIRNLMPGSVGLGAAL